LKTPPEWFELSKYSQLINMDKESWINLIQTRQDIYHKIGSGNFDKEDLSIHLNKPIDIPKRNLGFSQSRLCDKGHSYIGNIYRKPVIVLDKDCYHFDEEGNVVVPRGFVEYDNPVSPMSLLLIDLTAEKSVAQEAFTKAYNELQMSRLKKGKSYSSFNLFVKDALKNRILVYIDFILYQSVFNDFYSDDDLLSIIYADLDEKTHPDIRTLKRQLDDYMNPQLILRLLNLS